MISININLWPERRCNDVYEWLEEHYGPDSRNTWTESRTESWDDSWTESWNDAGQPVILMREDIYTHYLLAWS